MKKEGQKDRYEKADKNKKKKYPTNKFEKNFKKTEFKKSEKKIVKEPELIRLNRHIANSGLCSRREADEYIKAGLITVNGKVVTEMGTKISSGDIIKYKDNKLVNEKKVYILLNKPKDFVTTVKDSHAARTVMDLIRNACKERVYPVGRLDRNTTGVLLFTNDGQLAKKLTHPGYNKKKIYHVFLNKNLSAGDFKKIADGVTLEDGFIKPDSMSYVDVDDKSQIGLEIHSGRNRIVRRIFESLDYSIVKLDRVYFAGMTKEKLPRGRWRFLTDKEISMLKMDSYE